jgi:hypothetical protein
MVTQVYFRSERYRFDMSGSGLLVSKNLTEEYVIQLRSLAKYGI